MTLGERIKNRRIELGLTQTDLAIKLGYKDKTAISKIESGANELNQSKIIKFAEVLNTTTSYLMGWEDKSDLEEKADKAADLFLNKEENEEPEVKELKKIYFSLTEVQRLVVLDMMKGLLNKDK